MNRLLAVLCLAAAALAGCSLLVSFDPEGQPCDPTATSPDKQCLAGYHCEANQCRKNPTGGTGGGP